VNADGCDLFLLDTAAGERPYSGTLADALSHDAEVAAGTDQHLFEHADKVDGAEVWAFLAGQVTAQIDDGVANELAGAMIGDVAATVDLVELNAALLQELIRCEDVGATGIPAECKYRRVLKQKKGIADEVLLTCCDDLLLDREGFGIGDATEME
jgi:hypothetical protein